MTGRPHSPAAGPVVFGADYSVYVRIVRMVLEHKGVNYELVPVDVFAVGGLPDWYRERYPFGKIPAFEHDGMRLYETSAIVRYSDEIFPAPKLQPADVKHRAVMNQIISVLDAYAYPTLVWGIYVAETEGGATGAPDAAMLQKAQTCLSALDDLKLPGRWLLGDALTLADIHAAPMFALFAKSETGASLLAAKPSLQDWFASVSALDAFAATEPATEPGSEP